MSNKQSVLQSMLWAAYGDALGFITEMCRSKSDVQRRTGGVDRVTELIPWVRKIGGVFGADIELPTGCYSDDTQLRLATCRSIRGNGVFDVETFSRVELPVWLSYSLGAGLGTKTAADSLKKKGVQWYSNFYHSKYADYLESGGNGTAMRIQPHVWCAPPAKSESDILKDVIRNTITTHGHTRAIVGAAFHALCLQMALSKRISPDPSDWISILEPLQWIPSIIRSEHDLSFFWLSNWESGSGKALDMAIQQSVAELREDIMLAKSTLKEAQARGEAKKSYHYLVKQIGCLERNLAGSATKTALLASYVSYIFRDQPYEGLVETVNVLGSDTDTIATMAGAILGVMANDDPPQAVMDMEYLKKEAERLYQLSEGYETKSFVYPDMLYWQPPATQIDSLGEHEGKLVLQGLGGAEPVSQSTFEQGKDSNWEWMKLEFGQTVLVRRRSKAVTVTKDSLPVNPAHIATEKKFYSKRYSTPVAHPGRQMSNQGQLLRAQMPLVTPQREEITIDRATDEVIRSGFREDVIGSMLIKLAVQENGIEKAIAFASIVAKSKLARMKKHSDYK